MDTINHIEHDARVWHLLDAVSDAAKRGVSINNSTIYVTHFPCINCAKTIISSGIKNVKYKEEYKHDNLVDQLFEISGVNVECL